MMDGFSGYNQVVVHPKDQNKTAFTTPWGMFMYARMPFGLINAGAAFQRAMDITFVGEQDKFVAIYLDDINVFSKTNDDHIEHPRITFEECKKYGPSLNPKKSRFALSGGKLLGHIAAKEGVKIYPKRVEAINNIPLPRNKKEIQVSLGRINFLRRFIPNYTEIVKEITEMLKKDKEVKWTEKSRESFSKIKKAFAEALVLVCPAYLKPFFIFSLASPHTMAAVLLQKNSEGHEKPITFFSQVLQDAELKYNILEKQTYALVKALKAFKICLIVKHNCLCSYSRYERHFGSG